MNEPGRTPEAPRDDSAQDRARVNPAARRDRPGQEPPPAPEDPSKDEEQVPPAQEEPLDPLGPGGIGG